MLVLQRNINEEIILDTSDGRITVMLVNIRNDQTARIGITAPKCVTVNRAEIQALVDQGIPNPKRKDR